MSVAATARARRLEAELPEVALETEVLSIRTVAAGARYGRLLRLSPSEPVRIARRLHLAGGERAAVETLHVPDALVPGLGLRALSRPEIDAVLETDYGIRVVRSVQAIEPTVTDEAESAELGIPLHSPALLVERTSFSDSGATVAFSSRVYRGDRFRLVGRLTRGGG